MAVRQPQVTDLYQEEIYKIKDQVLIVLSSPWQSISQEEKTLLSKILGAIKLSLDSVQIISKKNLDFKFIKNYAPKWVLQFSNDSDSEFPYYIVTSIEGVSIIKSHVLADLDDARKKSLWMALKGLFQG